MRFKTPATFFWLSALLVLRPFAACSAAENQGPESVLARKLTAEGATAFEAGDLDTGRAKFEKALELDAKNVVVLINLGSLEYRAKHLDAAEKALKQATRLAPETFSAWL